MQPTLSATETARIEALLSRLDPQGEATCEVHLCLHVHHPPRLREDVPALAA